MRVEPKQAFYNEDTGAVQPWKDIEVTDAVGNALVAEGLVTEIEGGGGGGGGDFSTCTVTVSCTYEGVGEASVGTFFYVDNDINNLRYTNASFFDDDEERDPVTLTNVILYQGNAEVELSAGSYVSSTGAVEYNEETLMFTITGDCTITVALVN